MSFVHPNRLENRLAAAAKAREVMLARFRARPSADEPAVKTRRDERRALIAAREARAEARELARIAEAERLETIAQAEREAQAARKAAELEAAAERARLAQAKQKEERDARYAARKDKIRMKR